MHGEIFLYLYIHIPSYSREENPSQDGIGMSHPHNRPSIDTNSRRRSCCVWNPVPSTEGNTIVGLMYVRYETIVSIWWIRHHNCHVKIGDSYIFENTLVQSKGRMISRNNMRTRMKHHPFYYHCHIKTVGTHTRLFSHVRLRVRFFCLAVVQAFSTAAT